MAAVDLSTSAPCPAAISAAQIWAAAQAEAQVIANTAVAIAAEVYIAEQAAAALLQTIPDATMALGIAAAQVEKQAEAAIKAAFAAAVAEVMSLAQCPIPPPPPR